VRPFGSTEVTLTLQLANPELALGTGKHTPLFDKMSLAIGEVTVIGARTLGSMGIAMSGAVKVIVAVVVWPTAIGAGANVMVSEVVS
jgi:hypothetical protein